MIGHMIRAGGRQGGSGLLQDYEDEEDDEGWVYKQTKTDKTFLINPVFESWSDRHKAFIFLLDG